MDNLKSKSAYITFYKLVCFCLTMLSLYVLYKFCMTLWETRTPYVETFQHNILSDKSAPAHSTDEMLGHLKNTGISFGYFVLSLIGIHIIKRFWKATPVPGAFIKYWDDQGQIPHVLGRMICTHLRNNLRFSNEDWVATVAYSQSQTYFFYKASKSKHYANIFKKYDGNYRLDAIPEAAPAIDQKTLSATKKIEVKTTSATTKTIQPKVEPAPAVQYKEPTLDDTPENTNKLDGTKEPTL